MSQAMCHVIQAFCPFKFFAAKFAAWTAHFTKLHNLEDEVFDYEKRTILIDPGADGEEWALAHAAAHLELEHRRDGDRAFTDQQEEDANALAAAWFFDGTWPWPAAVADEVVALDLPLDGPPTVTRL